MKIMSVEMITSAVKPEQYPQDNLPEIALAGRSNVGKSTFINRMLGRRNIAHTSSKPGKTRTINFYKINNAFYFVDVPGYGYARVSKKEKRKWGPMMEKYFETREQLKAVILLTDLRHKPTKDDLQMYEYLKYMQLPVMIVGTKHDQVKKNKQDEYLERTLQYFNPHVDDIILPFSAKSNIGKDEIWRLLKNIL